MTYASTPAFWRGKRVLVTGHTGFKGSWLTLWLHRLGAHVTGIALPPATDPSLFVAARVQELCDNLLCDIRDATKVRAAVQAARPQIVFHLAAQPLVRAGYREPLATFASNVMGSVHLLDALGHCADLRAAVMVTTDKVYRETHDGRAYREDDALGGADPYSASKAACELAIACYRDSYLKERGIAVASARAGNVIGGGDWSEDRIIPDAVRAWSSGCVLHIRRPQAVRPWQHVLEPLGGYLQLAQALAEGRGPAEAYNFGPPLDTAVPVRELVTLAREVYGSGDVEFADVTEGPHEAAWLALNAGKAEAALGVAPVLTLTQAVERTMEWYRAYSNGEDARELCIEDIAAFENLHARQELRRAV
jgi:CDP-glucose 4,6-dehydratase